MSCLKLNKRDLKSLDNVFDLTKLEVNEEQASILMSEEDNDQTCSTICQSPSVTQHSKTKIQKNDKNETSFDI